MHPVIKRILIHGGLTAGILALVGVLFADLATALTASGTGRTGSEHLNPPPDDSLRSRVPLTMAAAGFLFVAVCELVLWRVRGNRPPAAKPTGPQPDDAEKLLNELLAQAEAKMALEKGVGDRGDGTEQKEARSPVAGSSSRG